MIKSVKLFFIYRKTSSQESKNIDLFPPSRKPIKTPPDSQIDYIYFELITNYEAIDPHIKINNFETLNLYNVKKIDGSHTYESDKVSSRSFLGFNLGLFDLNIYVDSEEHRLSTVQNNFDKPKEKKLQYMYEVIASSIFFNFYISRFNRANTMAMESNESSDHHFWLRISIANDLLKEVEKFKSGELIFTNRITKTHTKKKYFHGLQVDKDDINWLLFHPNELIPDPYGEINYSGLRYDIDNIKSTNVTESYDTYENNLLISSLYSVKSQLTQLCEDYYGTTLFPHDSVESIISEVDASISFIKAKLNLQPPYNTVPGYSNKYIDDIRYIKLFELISKWYSIIDLKYGKEIRCPILGVTKIFEHYCFIVLIKSFELLGFVINDFTSKNTDEAGVVTLYRENERVSIYYEPHILKNDKSPLTISRLKSNHFDPDIVLTYSDGVRNIYGVIDPKFSDVTNVKNILGPEIYYKYGMFLHTPNNMPLDFVFAMCPSFDSNSSIYNERDPKYIEQIKPSLGFFTISLDDSAIKDISKNINLHLLNSGNIINPIN